MSRPLTEHRAPRESQRAPEIPESELALLDALVVPTAILRLHDRVVLAANPAFADLLGLPRKAILGKDPCEIATPVDDQARAEALAEFSRAGHVEGRETSLITAAGTRREVAVYAKTIERGGEWLVVMSLVDVTARKQAEQALRDSEEKFSHVFQASGSILCVIRPKDFTITEVNPAFSRAFGIAREDAIGKSMDEVTARFGSGMDPARRAAMREQLAQGAELRDVPVTFRTIEGERRDLLVSVNGVTIKGEPFYLFRAIDVTEHAKLTASLRAADEMFSRIFRSAAQPMGIARMSDEIIIDVNDALPPLLGLPREEVVGKTAAEAGVRIHPVRTRAARSTLERDGLLQNEEIEITTPRGERRTLLVSVAFITLDKEPCLFFTASDITSRKEMESALRIANADLDAFATTVAHDLRSPLRAVSNLADVLLQDHRETLPADAVQHLETLVREAHRAGHLVGDLLTFARLGPALLERTRVDTEALARVVAVEAEDDARRFGLRLRVASMPPCMGDASLLRIVLTNLVSNAIKFSRTKAGHEILLGWSPDAGGAYFVQDHGVGFDMAEADKLFTIFHRLPGAKGTEGTGVGLAVCRRIVEKHGGRMWAMASPGEGASFFFTIPPPE